MLVRHPGTAATRLARLPLDEPALGPAPELSGWRRRGGTVVTSPARRCSVAGAPVDALLRPWDLGNWAGLPLAEVPELPSWRSDPSYAGHGGESLLALLERVRAFLDQHRTGAGRTVAITHGAVVRAALVNVLRAAPEAFWDLDIAPGGVTELRATQGGWRVRQVNVPIACSVLRRHDA